MSKIVRPALPIELQKIEEAFLIYANQRLMVLEETAMTRMREITPNDTITNALAGNITRIYEALTLKWPSLSLSALLNCQGNWQSVVTTIARTCDVSNEAATARLHNAVKSADQFSNDATSRRQMAIYWTELSDDDFTTIGESRSCLVNHLQQRYHISRETAWQHVHIFFAQVLRHEREKP